MTDPPCFYSGRKTLDYNTTFAKMISPLSGDFFSAKGSHKHTVLG